MKEDRHEEQVEEGRGAREGRAVGGEGSRNLARAISSWHMSGSGKISIPHDLIAISRRSKPYNVNKADFATGGGSHFLSRVSDFRE